MASILAAQGPEEKQRDSMVRDQIEARGIKSPQVLRVMRETPRHLFLSESLRSQAYEDRPVPIGYGQTISQPFIVAFMTDQLEVRKEHRVLEIGTGSGYQAAVLSRLAGEVYTIEIVPELARSAQITLSKLGYKNVFVRHGDGYKGWPEKVPFDRVILTAAPTELPQVLVDQLKAGGKLLGPVGGSTLDQQIVMVEKSIDGQVRKRSVLPVRFVPMVKAPGSIQPN